MIKIETIEVAGFAAAFSALRLPFGKGCRSCVNGSDEHVEKQWGGARPGAGRRPADPEDKRVQMVITIDRDTRDKLKARAKEQHVRVGRLIDEWVNETFYI